MVNESKRCSNDLKWSHMPSNGSKKPPLAFFKKSPGFGWILDITLLGGRWEAAGTLWRVPGRTGEGEMGK